MSLSALSTTFRAQYMKVVNTGGKDILIFIAFHTVHTLKYQSQLPWPNKAGLWLVDLCNSHLSCMLGIMHLLPILNSKVCILQFILYQFDQ